MEITTIVGIAIAIVIMAFGLKMILKKPTDSAPSLDSELQFNEIVNNRLFHAMYVTNCKATLSHHVWSRL